MNKHGSVVDVDVDMTRKEVCITRQDGWFRLYENVTHSTISRLIAFSGYGWISFDPLEKD